MATTENGDTHQEVSEEDVERAKKLILKFICKYPKGMRPIILFRINDDIAARMRESK